MLNRNPHLSMRHMPDEDLVRLADGELSSLRASAVDAHLEACWDCRARMEEIQSMITTFARAHHTEFDAQLPPATGPRALLRALMSELSSQPRTELWKRVFQLGFSRPRAAIVCLPLIAIAIGVLWFRHSSQTKVRPASVLFDAKAAPNRSLTPGATHQVTVSEVCSVPHEELVGDVSFSLRQRVLEEYGIANARPGDYEIDYLIAPRLGGTDDIRNLWREPYGRVWNARVKDALEERLHEMVCSGQLDLRTAQQDIARDWIAGYKKYFHTSKPLPLSSQFD